MVEPSSGQEHIDYSDEVRDHAANSMNDTASQSPKSQAQVAQRDPSILRGASSSSASEMS
jgi:hypothetical protein